MDADDRPSGSDAPLPRFDFNALTRPDSWASPRPVHPDGTPAPGASDQRIRWPRYQHRFAAVTGRPYAVHTITAPDRTAAEARPTMSQTPAEQRLPVRRGR